MTGQFYLGITIGMFLGGTIVVLILCSIALGKRADRTYGTALDAHDEHWSHDYDRSGHRPL
jgi:hypothetical protein